MSRVVLGMSCCDRSAFLPEAIASMLAVRGVDHCIIRCDGSPIAVQEIAIGLADIHRDRLTVLFGDRIGPGESANEIAKIAGDCDYLGFIDSDDFVYPGAVEACLRVFGESGDENLGAVYTQQHTLSEHGQILGLDHKSTIPFSEEILSRTLIVTHFRLISASIFREMRGFKKGWMAAVDYEFFLRMCGLGYAIKQVQEPHYGYRQHSDRISIKSRGLQWANAQRAKVEYLQLKNV